ncbi:MAG: Ig domain-containing protein [bacterium]
MACFTRRLSTLLALPLFCLVFIYTMGGSCGSDTTCPVVPAAASLEIMPWHSGVGTTFTLRGEHDLDGDSPVSNEFKLLETQASDKDPVEVVIWGPVIGPEQAHQVTLPAGQYTATYRAWKRGDPETGSATCAVRLFVTDCPVLCIETAPTVLRDAIVPIDQTWTAPPASEGQVYSATIPWLNLEYYTLVDSLSSDTPSGLTFNSATGQLEGVPDAGSTRDELYEFHIEARPVECPQDLSLRFLILLRVQQPACAAIELGPLARSNAYLGQEFRGVVPVIGGGPPLSLAVTDDGGHGIFSVAEESGRFFLVGTPLDTGNVHVVVTATDSCPAAPQTVSRTYRIGVTEPGLGCTPTLAWVSSSDPPPAEHGIPYEYTLRTTGGVGAVTYGVSGRLPGGLSFGDSIISGIPTEPGSFELLLAAIDACLEGPQVILEEVMLFVGCEPLVIDQTVTIPPAFEGEFYACQFRIASGVEPVSWRVVPPDGLPDGLTIAPTSGWVIGSPTTLGTASFTVVASDACGPSQIDTWVTSITVHYCAPLRILQEAPPSGVVGFAYSDTFQIDPDSPGTPPFVWSIDAGSLPPGLGLTAAGVLLGTPTRPAITPYEFTVRVSDDCESSHGDDFVTSILIEDSCPALAIDPSSPPPDGAVGEPYSYSFALQDTAAGDTPVIWNLSHPGLPPGLTLGPAGEIKGTPTQGRFDPYRFTVRVTDSCVPAQTDVWSVSLTVPPAGAGQWELHAINTSAASENKGQSAVVLGNGYPALVYPVMNASTNWEKRVMATVAGTTNPTAGADWSSFLLLDGVADHPQATLHDGRLAIIFSDGDGDIRIAIATEDVPASSSDWFLTTAVLASEGGTLDGNSLQSNGTNLMFVWLKDDDTLQFCRSRVANPTGTASWDSYLVIDHAGDGSVDWPVMVLQSGAPRLGFLLGADLNKRPVFARATTTSPTSPADWAVHEVAAGGDLDSRVSVAIQANGYPAYSYNTGSLSDTSRDLIVGLASSETPADAGDWTWVTVDATEGGYSHLIDYNGRLLVAYSLTYQSVTNTSLKVARAQTATPSSPGDWQLQYLHEVFYYGTYPQLVDLSPWHGTDLVGCFWDRYSTGEMLFSRREGLFE